MKKIFLKNNGVLIIDNILYIYLEKNLKENIKEIKETKQQKKTSFYIAKYNDGDIKINTCNAEKTLLNCLLYKTYKMYNYNITIKRKSHFLTSDFEITLKHKETKTNIKYYLFDVAM